MRPYVEQKDGIIGSEEIRLNVRNVTGHSTRSYVVKALIARSLKTRRTANNNCNVNIFFYDFFKTTGRQVYKGMDLSEMKLV